jgi:hypothetical protein
LGDVSATTVPKRCLTSPPADGGTLVTRMFIPRRVHASIGVLAAVTVGTAAAMPGSVAYTGASGPFRMEHPTGFTDVVVDLDAGRSAIVSTARLLMEYHGRSRRPWLRKRLKTMAEKIRDIAHVSAVQLLTPVLDDTVRFFTEQMAMEVVERRGDSAYLHAWDDYEHFTVKVTGAGTSGIGADLAKRYRRGRGGSAGRFRSYRKGGPAAPDRKGQRVLRKVTSSSAKAGCRTAPR